MKTFRQISFMIIGFILVLLAIISPFPNMTGDGRFFSGVIGTLCLLVSAAPID